MTEKLKDLMDDVARVDFAPVDLDSVVRAGDRTVRRRRLAAGVGSLAAAALVAGGVYAVVPGDEGAKEPPVTGTPAAPVTYVLGSELHTPDGTRDLGHVVNAYVRTASGVVFTDRDGVVYADVDGVPKPLGQTHTRFPKLVADDEGSLVAWTDFSGERPAFVVHDLATGETSRWDQHTRPGMSPVWDGEEPAYVGALDGRTVYWHDTRGTVATDVDTGMQTVLQADGTTRTLVVAVEDGMMAWNVLSGVDDTGVRVGRELGADDALTLPGVYGTQAAFSTDARYVSVDADEPAVFDTTTGERVPIDVQGRDFATGYEWADEDTLVMIAAHGQAVDLLACEVPAGTCEVAHEAIGTWDQLQRRGFRLPVGEGMGE